MRIRGTFNALRKTEKFINEAILRAGIRTGKPLDSRREVSCDREMQTESRRRNNQTPSHWAPDRHVGKNKRLPECTEATSFLSGCVTVCDKNKTENTRFPWQETKQKLQITTTFNKDLTPYLELVICLYLFQKRKKGRGTIWTDNKVRIADVSETGYIFTVKSVFQPMCVAGGVGVRGGGEGLYKMFVQMANEISGHINTFRSRTNWL